MHCGLFCLVCWGLLLVCLLGFILLGGWWCHVGHDGECSGERIVILVYAFDVTGPSIPEKHVQGA